MTQSEPKQRLGCKSAAAHQGAHGACSWRRGSPGKGLRGDGAHSSSSGLNLIVLLPPFLAPSWLQVVTTCRCRQSSTSTSWYPKYCSLTSPLGAPLLGPRTRHSHRAPALPSLFFGEGSGWRLFLFAERLGRGRQQRGAGDSKAGLALGPPWEAGFVVDKVRGAIARLLGLPGLQGHWG